MNALHDHRLDPSDVSPEELRQIARLVAEGGPAALVGSNGEPVAVPPALGELFAFVLAAMERRQAVVVMPEDQALTTSQAARILGVSRPYLTRLLDEGRVASHRAGTHRRVLLADLRAYQAERDRQRRRALDELTVALDEAGVYDQE